MIINRSFKDFKFRHRSKKNQIIYTSKKVKNDNKVLNLIDNFLLEKNSFIFEKKTDKVWEFNKNNSFLIKNKKKIKLKQKPAKLIEDSKILSLDIETKKIRLFSPQKKLKMIMMLSI